MRNKLDTRWARGRSLVPLPSRSWTFRGRLLRLGQLGGAAARHDDDRDRRGAGDLGRARAEEDPREGPDRARAHDEHVAVAPFDILQRLAPVLAGADDRLA